MSRNASQRMSAGMMVALVVVFVAPFTGVARAQEAKVVVELVPDHPGPYQGDQSLTVDVWLHSQVSFDAHLWLVQLDFSDSDGQLLLDPTFTFDLSSSIAPADFDDVHPELPIPWAANTLLYICPECRLQLPAGGSLHIGSISVKLPTALGTYRLDVLNVDDPDENHGAWVYVCGNLFWRAFTGEITGGAYSFAVTIAAIPTVSQWGIIAMGLLLLVFGSLMILRRTRSATDASCFPAEGTGTGLVCNEGLRSRAPLFTLICALGVLLGSSSDATAEAPLRPVETIQVGIDSGILSPTGTGNGPVVVFSRFVQIKGASWVRLRFGEVQLSGSCADGDESFIRITSLCDDVQLLDSAALEAWGDTSAYFNGDRVLVELVARANTGANRLTIDRIAAGLVSGFESTNEPCGTDDRVPSSDPRAARFRYRKTDLSCNVETWCTAFLFDDRASCALSARHCCQGVDWTCGFPPVVEFNVPESESDGTINYAHPDDQYPVEQISLDQWQRAGIGDDWCYFGVFNNTNTEKTPLEAQGDSYQLVQTVPDADGSTLRVTGHGIHPAFGLRHERNGIQQTDSGPYDTKSGTTVRYVVDIAGGNSGSAVEHVSDGLVYAIVSHGGCTATGGVNRGTAVDHPGLQDALACETGMCALDCNSNGIIDQCDIDCSSCGEDCNVPGCGTGSDCFNSNGIPDECEGIIFRGACCVGTDCVPGMTQCACTEQGGTYQGQGSTCQGPRACWQYSAPP